MRSVIFESWGDELIVGRGISRRVGDLRALVALGERGERVGVATFDVDGDAAELVTLDALRSGAGVGRALVDGVAAAARAAGARRLIVMTTNDNLRALRFYQRYGFRLVALRPEAVDEARRLVKPSIPSVGEDGIPIRDEIDLELDL
jgi:ribosomal protein S18 acetylase RimI-like enzyme